MTDEELDVELQKLYNSVEVPKLEKCIQYLREKTNPSDQKLIEDYYNQYGKFWYTQNHFHFGAGMWFRNHIRRGGFDETYFCIANLDDLYIKLLENAFCNVSTANEAKLCNCSIDTLMTKGCQCQK